VGILEIVLLGLLAIVILTGARARSFAWVALPCILVMAFAWILAYFLDEPLVTYGAAAGCLTGAVSAKIAQRKGRSIAGWFIAGMLLNLLAIILIAVMEPNVEVVEHEALSSGSVKRCPHCAELVRREAVKCRFCGEALPRVAE